MDLLTELMPVIFFLFGTIISYVNPSVIIYRRRLTDEIKIIDDMFSNNMFLFVIPSVILLPIQNTEGIFHL